MRKSIKKNYIYNLSYQILQMITPLITTPYLSRILGADGIGTVSYAESVVSYFTLFAVMGITTYGQREISYVQDSKDKRSEVFWNTLILKCTTSFIVIIVYMLFAFSQENFRMYILLSFNILSVMLDITWFFEGMEEFGRIALRNMFFKVANVIYIFVVVNDKDDILLYIFGLSFFTFLGNVSLWGYLRNYIKGIDVTKLNPYKSMPIVLSLFVPTIAIQIYTVLDKTMIGIITNDSFENGYYEQAIKIAKIALAMVTALGAVVKPRIGFYFQNGESDKIRQVMHRGYRFVWFLGIPLCLGLMMVAGNFVPWFFGKGFDKAIILIQILSLLILAIGINNVTGVQYLIPTKRQNLFTLTVAIGAFINFVLNFILIRKFKSIGAAVASVLAETTIAIIQLIIVRKELSLWHIVKDSLHYVFAGIVMAIVLRIMNKTFSASIIHTVLMVICGAMVYFWVLLIMRDEFFVSNIKNILNKIKRH